ncbi:MULTISPECIES: HD domain-containing protein [unclassified Bacillus (in: firmicutes)]|uniref:HD domain-containing protein n=1 Tax=unclassified Bacillus (in: firmicutes) TaxID=185979 RepID=UPI0008EEA86E|nr:MULTISPECIES: HD domain-containing protein [unclassified Bacillus (in: firmicutes)]SFJ54254.1 HD domain-containing protein [Bacillus sp. 71mf]SFT19030.1 HD domain-containing protein [Bacillus sp. 103mf]
MSRLIEKAMQFAAIKHEGQMRKGTNIPYIIHPFGVALILQKEKQCDEVIAAGLLHDTLEDTSTTEAELCEHFGEEVLKLVQAASEPDKLLSWEERKKHTIQSLSHRSNEEITLIIADKLHNLRSIQEDVEREDDQVWSRFNRGKRDQSWYYMSILHALKGKKEDIPIIRVFEKETQNLFIGKETLTLKDIDVLFSSAYGIYESQKEKLHERGLIKFAREVSTCSEAIYRSGHMEMITPLVNDLQERGVSFEFNSDGSFILLAYLTELKHRMGWSDELFYQYYLRNCSKL